jgi:hypothetical protein
MYVVMLLLEYTKNIGDNVVAMTFDLYFHYEQNFCDLRILIIPLVSSNSSMNQNVFYSLHP